MATAASLLASIETAISAVLTTGQSYRLGDRTVTRADLTELFTLRDKLKAEVLAAEFGHPGVAAADMRGNF